MKTIKYIFICIFVGIVSIACNEGIDSITKIDPGPDQAAPTISISYPTEGLEIIDMTEFIPMTFQASISDDIELESITISLNGVELTKYNQFKDYRRYVLSYLYDKLGDGNHKLTILATDVSGKNSSKSVNFVKSSRYLPKYNGEIFYMPFDDNNQELISETNALKIGSPTFTSGKIGKAYKGAVDSYLSYKIPNTISSAQEFSAVFWYKLDVTIEKGGILTVSADDPASEASAKNNRNFGFRLFREKANGGQTFKLNVGNGSSDSWFDGGATATLIPETTGAGWVFIAFTISKTECSLYFNGQAVKTGAFNGSINWANCEAISIGSGAPYFTGWGHMSDASLYDELRLFNKALTQNEIKAIMNSEK